MLDWISILQKCRKRKDLACAKLVHVHICNDGLEALKAVGNYIVPMFVECGSLCDAQHVFNSLTYRNEHSWTALILGYIQSGELRHALNLYQKMQEENVEPSSFTLVTLLKACAVLKDVERGREIHVEISRKGFERDLFVGNTLVSMYAKCGSLLEAHEVFDLLPVQEVVSWTALVTGYGEHGPVQESLVCFEQMQREGVSPDVVTFVCMLKACGSIRGIDRGRQLHAEIIQKGLERSPAVANNLIFMYAKCGSLSEAKEICDKLPAREVVSWTALIAGYAEHGPGQAALKCFEQMCIECVRPDAVTLICVLKASCSLGALNKCQEIHMGIIQMGLERDPLVVISFVDMYGKFGLLSEAWQVLDKLPVRDVASWNALLTGNVAHGYGKGVLKYFEKMQLEGVPPNAVTFTCLLKACCCMETVDNGREIHMEITQKGLDRDLSVSRTLVVMYAKCHSLPEACKVFNELPGQEIMSWTALIAGYTEHGLCQEALNCFEQMQLEGLSPDAFTLVCVLKACGRIRALKRGLEIHNEATQKGFEDDLFVSNALVDMYVKCGSFSEAQEVLAKLPIRDAVSWNTLIAGCAEHGLGQETLNCFEQMRMDGVSPDAISLVCIIKACSSEGAIDKARAIHSQITHKGFACDLFVGNAIIDMYGKCGLLSEAQEVVSKLPFQDVVSWNAIIAGYVEHGPCQEAVKCFEQMQKEGIFPDAATFVCVLKACGSIGAINKGREIHMEIIDKGFEKDVLVGTTLVDMYVKCGLCSDARDGFDKLPVQEVIGWTALTSGYTEHNLGQEALICFEEMQVEGVFPNAFTFVCILKACSSIGATEKGKEIHGEITVKGFDLYPLVANALIDMYAKCRRFFEAWEVLMTLQVQELLSWTVLISGYFEHGLGLETLECFEQMQLEGITPNAFTYVCVLKVCGSTRFLDKGQELYTQVIQKGLESDVLVGSALVSMYGKCGSFSEARYVFDRLQVQDVVRWNVLIAVYEEHGLDQEGIKCFGQMQVEGISPDAGTFGSALKACGSIGALNKGREIHTQIIRNGLEMFYLVGNCLVDMYAKCGSILEAQEVFCKLPAPDIMSRNSLIAGYADYGPAQSVLACFEEIQLEGIPPDSVTVFGIVKACGSIGAIDKGREIHTKITQLGFDKDPLVSNTLVGMYVKCGSPSEAWDILGKLPSRNVVSWTTLISGYAELSLCQEALKCFEWMQQDAISPNAVTCICTLKACGSTGALDTGRGIHAQVVQNAFERGSFVVNSVVDMYAKCGSLFEAQEVFAMLSVQDIVSWNVLITGYAEHGSEQEALKCFEQMQLEGISPDAVTFGCVLKACGNIGATKKGQNIHREIMQTGFDGYIFVGNTLINMYVKCGLLSEAWPVFNRLSGRDVVSWTSLIAGYAISHEENMALQCFKEMQEQGIKPNAVTFTCLLTACSHAALVLKGQEYFKVMTEEYVIALTIDHYTCIVDLLARSGHLYESEKLLEAIPCSGSEGAWRALLSGCKAYGDAELGLRCFQQLVQMNPKDASPYVLMEDIYADAGRWDYAYEIWEMRKLAGAKKKPGCALIEVNKKVYEFLVGNNRSKESSLFQENLSSRIKEEGHVPHLDLVSNRISDAEQ